MKSGKKHPVGSEWCCIWTCLVEGSVQSTGLLLMSHPFHSCIPAALTGNAAPLGCLTRGLMSKNLLKSFFELADPVDLPSLSW